MLFRSLKNRATKRIYIALLDGLILNEAGVVDAPIGRDKTDRKRMAVCETGKPAITHFQVKERFADDTLVECRLETGRTHQIRVHMAYIGHPLYGDSVYGRKKQRDPFGQYLHAQTLGFTHPRTEAWLEFNVPLPQEFTERLQFLREQ